MQAVKEAPSCLLVSFVEDLVCSHLQNVKNSSTIQGALWDHALH